MQHIINSQKHGSFKILIDREDWEKVKDLGTYIHKIGKYYYVNTKHKVYLHRVIMAPIPPKHVVDHINRNTLDNRKKNLRITTIQGNLQNQRRSNNKTGYTGVSIGWGGKFNAQIKIDYKKIHLGTFETIEQARAARERAEEKYFIKRA